MKKHAWIGRIKRGDILAEGSSLRVVREVRHGENGRVSVTFTIKHCSWTTRCYTVLTHSDLKTRGFRPTGKRVRLTGKLDAEIERNFGVHIRETTLHCCDVEGIG